jgi:peptidoglycan/LPS O-acetylase OafA/YrhL
MKYRANIDGLRAAAVLLVVLFHADFHAILPVGFVGVDVFFVISGYLITSIIKSEMVENTFTFGHFYARRIRRMLPAMIPVCVHVKPEMDVITSSE